MIRKFTPAAKDPAEMRGTDFMVAILNIPPDVFGRMVMKAGLPAQDSSNLCLAHKRLRKP